MAAACPTFAFTVRIDLPDSSDERHVIDSLETVLDANGLSGARTGSHGVELVVTRDAGQATQSDRELVQSWAAKLATPAAVRVSDLIDLSE